MERQEVWLLLFLCMQTSPGLPDEESGEKREVDKPDFDHQKEDCFLFFGELHDPAVCDDNPKNDSQWINISCSDNDELDNAMLEIMLPKFMTPTNEQPFLIAVHQNVGQTENVVDHLFGNQCKDVLDLLNSTFKSAPHYLPIEISDDSYNVTTIFVALIEHILFIQCGNNRDNQQPISQIFLQYLKDMIQHHYQALIFHLPDILTTYLITKFPCSIQRQLCSVKPDNYLRLL